MATDTSQQFVKLKASQAQAVQAALQQWSGANLISPDLLTTLLNTLLAVLCFSIGILTLILGNVFPKIIKKILALPIALRTVAVSCMGIATHILAYQRSLVAPKERYLNEAIHGLGALIFALAALQIGYHLKCNKKKNRNKLSHLFLSLATIYGIVAILVKSNFIWSCGMIMFGIWLGAIAGYMAGMYYLGYTYPLRFVLLGIGLIGSAYLMRRSQYTVELWSTTRIWGMIYLFDALWILSLFGMDSLFGNAYKKCSLYRQLVWSLVFAFAAAFSVWHGLKYHDSTTRGFGLAYLGINLYTKFFEIFWKALYKSIFFTLLAFSLALLGRYAEQMNVVLQESYDSVAG
ncbi:uncharacterized protein F4822DRAFT_433375 [Hypoxylon trugodes]|uniref:uncharacterized protein n=1 Tax=Hypoxylon trugodes TaxID=326681 RepID=UPI002195D476|nr:uncharacterized protein F4822DRAFT_433375 [Hypoxylon trugodes]KAI1384836.1 hypothetical protein F4822DRAFT_433375 [Hypoxylon trugodes]